MTYLQPEEITFLIIPTTISIIIALLASSSRQKSSQNKARLFISLLPLIINVVILIILLIMESIKNNGFPIDKLDLLFMPVLIIIICSFGAGLIIFFVIKKDVFSQGEIDKYYTKLTEDLGDNKTTVVVGGDLDFLGGIGKPICINKICKNEFDSGRDCPKCKDKCFIISRQFKQLFKAITEQGCKLQILSNKPNFLSELKGDKAFRLILGKLLKDFILKLEIHCFDEGKELPIRGRMITTHNSTRKICWHWKKSSDYYSCPILYDDSDPDGQAILSLFDFLWDNTKELSYEERAHLQREYENYIEYCNK